MKSRRGEIVHNFEVWGQRPTDQMVGVVEQKTNSGRVGE